MISEERIKVIEKCLAEMGKERVMFSGASLEEEAYRQGHNDHRSEAMERLERLKGKKI